MIPTMTEAQKAMLAQMKGEFGGTTSAELYGTSEVFPPGKGRVTFGATKFQGKHFIIESTTDWFRGGLKRDPADPANNARRTQAPDNALNPGDLVANFIDKTANTRGPHFKNYGLAVLRALAISKGHDPSAIMPDAVTDEVVAAIHVQQLQVGLSVDFDATSIVTGKKSGRLGVFTKVEYHGDRKLDPPPATVAAPQPAAVPASAPAANPLAALGLGGSAPAETPAAAPSSNPLDLLGLGGSAPAETPAAPAPDALGALGALVPAGPTRAEKVAAIKAAQPQLAAVDFDAVDDTTLDAAFAQVSG